MEAASGEIGADVRLGAGVERCRTGKRKGIDLLRK
jgi:hypothetical protein